MRYETSIQARDLPLTDEQIMKVAPSVFTAERSPTTTSARFTPVPTVQVLASLREWGFQPFYAGQSRARSDDRRLFTKHMLRLRPASVIARNVGDTFPEVVVVNANDGTKAYEMRAGIFRLVCLNGAVVGDHLLPGLTVRHTGDIIGNVIEGAFTVVKDFEKVTARVEAFKGIQLDAVERYTFAHAALVAKLGAVTVLPENDVAQALAIRREQDAGADLWSVFNRVQENLLRGGVLATRANGRQTRTRAVTGITQGVDLNKRLWNLAEDVAKAKLAA